MTAFKSNQIRTGHYGDKQRKEEELMNIQSQIILFLIFQGHLNPFNSPILFVFYFFILHSGLKDLHISGKVFYMTFICPPTKKKKENTEERERKQKR